MGGRVGVCVCVCVREREGRGGGLVGDDFVCRVLKQDLVDNG